MDAFEDIRIIILIIAVSAVIAAIPVYVLDGQANFTYPGTIFIVFGVFFVLAFYALHAVVGKSRE